MSLKIKLLYGYASDEDERRDQARIYDVDGMREEFEAQIAGLLDGDGQIDTIDPADLITNFIHDHCVLQSEDGRVDQALAYLQQYLEKYNLFTNLVQTDCAQIGSCFAELQRVINAQFARNRQECDL